MGGVGLPPGVAPCSVVHPQLLRSRRALPHRALKIAGALEVGQVRRGEIRGATHDLRKHRGECIEHDLALGPGCLSESGSGLGLGLGSRSGPGSPFGIGFRLGESGSGSGDRGSGMGVAFFGNLSGSSGVLRGSASFQPSGSSPAIRRSNSAAFSGLAAWRAGCTRGSASGHGALEVAVSRRAAPCRPQKWRSTRHSASGPQTVRSGP